MKPERSVQSRPHPASTSADGVGSSFLDALVERPKLLSAQLRRGRGIDFARLVVVLVCLALISSNAWLVFHARGSSIAQANEASTNLARAVTDNLEGVFAQSAHILAGIVFELERTQAAPSAVERLQPVLVHHVADVASLDGLLVLNDQGRWITGSSPTWDPSAPPVDRPYFILHQRDPSTRTLIGSPTISRYSKKWIVPVSRRINDVDGNFAGVVVAEIRLSHLIAMLDRFNIGKRGAITVNVSNQVLVRKPLRDSDLGRAVPDSPVNKLYANQRSGTAEVTSPVDGVLRLLSFERTPNYPLVVIVASSKEEVLQEWRRASIVQTVWACLLCLALGLVGNYARLSLSRRLKAEASLHEASTALSKANRRLAQLAKFDELTGLPNRRYFDRRLARSFQQAQRERRPIAVVMIDVDEFKKYNDFYGHVEGDRCLRLVAASVASVVKRPEDMAARYGGEEMVLLLTLTGTEGAVRVAESARRAVLAQALSHNTAALGLVSISLGVAAYIPTARDTPENLMRDADTALYEAKNSGRNRIGLHGRR